MSDAAVEIVDVTKRFGAKLAVDHVSFAVLRGETYGLIGPNGAGKTTTFSMMCGFLHPTTGQIRILDADPRKPGALKRKLGVLPQDAILPPNSKVGELLTYWANLSGLERPEHEARTALERVELAQTWDTRAGALSHGMAKRVAMAQALMGKPPVVLLDEPTAGLDPKIAAQVRQVIREMKGEQTVIVSSHNLQELEELCDSAAILDRGKLVQAGSMSELTAQAAEFRVQIGRGTPPVDEMKILPGVSGATWDENTRTLLVQYDGRKHASDEVITRVLKLIIERDATIVTVSRGRKLEERVLQLT
ncbi:MAG: ABC transporter ATP-binding protein [Myxococcaceae bacterium]